MVGSCSRARESAGRFWVGTSGWSYGHWRGLFYPRALKPSDWLPYYAARLATVELNMSFYRLPPEAMLETFKARTPDDFLFAVKAWRLITHRRRLAGAEDALADFLKRIARLGPKLGPVLFQLPPRLNYDLARLQTFLSLLPKDQRFAFEFRDPSWHRREVYDLLARRNAAFCCFELGPLRSPKKATADFVYVRLHGRKQPYRGAYGAKGLKGWNKWLGACLTSGRDAYVYFDNTDEADHAVRDALRLNRTLSAARR
jgi:uncharacterized protein YecE (DUF72 family)